MNKYKYLFKNIGLLTLSSFATKLLSFFLVPLYTNILTTTEYGTYDLFNTTVGVLLPILTLNVQDAVMRFAMDRGRTGSGNSARYFPLEDQWHEQSGHRKSFECEKGIVPSCTKTAERCKAEPAFPQER